MAQSPSLQATNPENVIGRSGVDQKSAPQQQTDAQQRPGEYLIPLPSVQAVRLVIASMQLTGVSA